MTSIGGYVIEAPLGRGGQAMVYRARHPAGGSVAVKVLHDQVAGPARQRFLREAQALVQLDHVHIVRSLDAGEDDQGRPFLVMELIEGSSLQDALAQGPLPLTQALDVAVAAARALEHAHGRGILHRDLKPDNVLLADDGRTLLVDFGLAKELGAAGPSLSTTGRWLGTPGYWPPEQASGRHGQAGPHSDIYALGGTIYAMLTGRPPQQGESLQEVLASLAAGPPSLREARPDADPRLDDLVRRCLAERPEDRPRSAWQVRTELEAVQADLEAAEEEGRSPRAKRAQAVLARLRAGEAPGECRKVMRRLGATRREAREALRDACAELPFWGWARVVARAPHAAGPPGYALLAGAVLAPLLAAAAAAGGLLPVRVRVALELPLGALPLLRLRLALLLLLAAATVYLLMAAAARAALHPQSLAARERRQAAGLLGSGAVALALVYLLLLPSLRDCLDLGDRLRAAAFPHHALRIYDAAVKVDPGAIEARLRRAGQLLALGRGEEARPDLDRVLELDARSAEALYLRGVLDQRAGRLASCRRVWAAFLQVEPAGARADRVRRELDRLGD